LSLPGSTAQPRSGPPAENKIFTPQVSDENFIFLSQKTLLARYKYRRTKGKKQIKRYESNVESDLETAPVNTGSISSPFESSLLPVGDLGNLGILGEDFVRLYQVVYKYLLHRLFDRELAEEFTAQIFYTAALKSNGIPGNAKEIEYWLIRMAINLANTHYRRQRWRRLLLFRYARTQDADADCQTVVHTQDDQLRDQIREAIKKLPLKDQTLIVLRYYNHKSFDEMAAVLGCRSDAIRRRLSRAVEKMRIQLSDASVTEK
jgi:RNA polymerase sigma factor (sigma-70 family)